MTRWLGIIVAVCTLIACGENEGTTAHNQSVANDSMNADDIYQGYFDDGGFLLPQSHSVIISRLEFFGTHEDGTAEGFDLDNRTSDYSDRASCGHPDLIAPDGREGIDNQSAVIWKTVGPLVGEAAHALLQGVINEGRLLMAIELTGVDDLQNDDDVQLKFFRARADPYVGTSGYLASDQTYYVDDEFPSTIIENTAIVDGRLTAGPVEFQYPIDVLEEFFIVHVSSGIIELTFHEDGSATGYLGGVVNVLDILAEGYQTNASQEFRLITPYFLNNTDMMPNDEGGCDGISIAMRINLTKGFMVHYDSSIPGQNEEN